MNIQFLSVDMQYDFTRRGGVSYEYRPSVEFVQQTFIPFLKEKNIQITEIISDYRPPRLGDRGNLCCPGEWGYTSEFSKELISHQWIKCMNSSIWSRKNIGIPNSNPGLPYPDPKKFEEWLKKAIGLPEENMQIVLLGLTLDCCVLCLAQELNWRGYNVLILYEATDTYSGYSEEKDQLFELPVSNWSKSVSWEKLISSGFV